MREVSQYTPRQVYSLLFIHDGMERSEKARELYLATLAAQGNNEDINKELKKISDGS